MGTFETIGTQVGGTRAWIAGDPTPGRPGVVVLHAWWGLNEDVRGFADRLADAGFAVAVPDLYRGPVASTIDEAERLSDAADQAAVDAIALAAIDDLVGRLGPSSGIACVGFSFGAAWSIWAAAERDAVAASVVYYGTVLGPSLARASVPVLGHFAESDPYEPDESVEAFESALRAAGREATIHRYPGTGHWFAEPSRDAYRPVAAELAFGRTVDFLARHLGSSGG